MTMWSIFTYILLPPALILLFLLTVPFPAMLNRGVVKTVDLLFGIEIGTIRVFSTITLISFGVLIAQTLDLQKRYDVSAEKGASVKGDLGYTSELQIKASRWRAERNWWISALTFVIYWTLLRTQSLKKQLLAEKQRQD